MLEVSQESNVIPCSLSKACLVSGSFEVVECKTPPIKENLWAKARVRDLDRDLLGDLELLDKRDRERDVRVSDNGGVGIFSRSNFAAVGVISLIFEQSFPLLVTNAKVMKMVCKTRMAR